MKLNELTAHELLTLLKAKKTSPDDIKKDVLAAITQHDKKIKAFVRTSEATGNTAQNAYAVPIALRIISALKG